MTAETFSSRKPCLYLGSVAKASFWHNLQNQENIENIKRHDHQGSREVFMIVGNTSKYCRTCLRCLATCTICCADLKPFSTQHRTVSSQQTRAFGQHRQGLSKQRSPIASSSKRIEKDRLFHALCYVKADQPEMHIHQNLLFPPYPTGSHRIIPKCSKALPL